MGKKFKDLNQNGKVDAYENWQLPVVQRVHDLIHQMTLEEKAGMMHAVSQLMGGSKAFGMTCPKLPHSLLCESDMTSPSPLSLHSPGSTKAILQYHLRYFIIRDSPRADVLAQWINEMQETAEGSRLGIPVVMVSNPRNHINVNKGIGFSESAGQFSLWPGELGLAAMRDLKLVKEFAQISAREWTASGIRKGYMYMADVLTDPLWTRAEGTFGEHPELVAAMNTAIIHGFQGDQLGPGSVSLTTKHFPGGGARVDGKDPHFAEGQWNAYPTAGSLKKYHLPPFKAAIQAGTTSILPYYAEPSNALSAPNQLGPGVKFEEVGFAYNKPLITDLLRGELGFKGYVNTDTGVTTIMPWGVEHLTIEERYAKAINAGSNLFSGEFDSSAIIQTVKKGLVAEEKINQSVSYLLNEMMRLGLFEDPYVNPKNALKVATDPTSQKKADEAHRKSIVLLRNDHQVLPIKDHQNVKLYVEIFTNGADKDITERFRKIIHQYDPSLELTSNLQEATHAFVWVLPSTPLRKPQIKIGPETGINHVARILEIEKKVPTVLAINMTNPWLIDKIEPGAAAVLSTFGVKMEALVDVICGRFNPTGKLPFTIPANQEAIVHDKGDVPGYDEDPSYVYKNKNGDAYGFGFGLGY
jgi:beta-glucosidase